VKEKMHVQKNSVSEIRKALDQWGVFFSRAKHTGWIRDGNCRKVNTNSSLRS